MDYRVRSEEGFFTAGYTRSKFPAWAAQGGSEGSPNYVQFRPINGDVKNGLVTKSEALDIYGPF